MFGYVVRKSSDIQKIVHEMKILEQQNLKMREKIALLEKQLDKAVTPELIELRRKNIDLQTKYYQEMPALKKDLEVLKVKRQKIGIKLAKYAQELSTCRNSNKFINV